MSCKIIRRKLITTKIYNLKTEEIKTKGQKWVTEPCGAPLFSYDCKDVCKSCLEGWTHEHNYPIKNKKNEQLLNGALASKKSEI